MNFQQVKSILDNKSFPDGCDRPELVETHISWIIITTNYAFKIKKPVKYSFLDFFSLKKRKFFCDRELLLNQRLTKGIYLEVLPITKSGDQISIGKSGMRVIDYAVKMKKLQRAKEMDLMLLANKVKKNHVYAIADELAPFHNAAERIHAPIQIGEMQAVFNDITSVQDFIRQHSGTKITEIIKKATSISGRFLAKNKTLIQQRSVDGFIRDCHGDLHSGNIFLYKRPVIFDCIEFNDDFRKIDVLNEIAFFCMDLEDYGRNDLSKAFLKYYLKQAPCIRDKNEERLFIYYKLYRANIKAKVNALKAMQADNEGEISNKLGKTTGYLQLMGKYCQQLS